MSGHSKWAGIKHKKAIVDAKRGQTFTRTSREITIAAKEGGGDTDGNFRLRLAIAKAREVNMPADKIQAAIDRGTGAGKGESLEELRYEGYGPAGVAIMVDVMTDNRNRTAPAIRHAFSKHGGSIEITTDPSAFESTRRAVEELGVKIESAELTMQPSQTVPVGEDKATMVLRLLEALEEEDDVQQVYANFDIPADVLERISASV